MKSTILDYIMSLFDSQTVNAMASQLGDSSDKISSATSTLVPTILAGAINKAQSEDNGTKHVMEMAWMDNVGNPWKDASNYLSTDRSLDQGSKILDGLFTPAAINNILTQVMGQTGLSGASTSKMLKWAASLTMAGLGKFISNNNLDASSLSTLFKNERNAVNAAMPAGLGLFSAAAGAAGNIKHAVSDAKQAVQEQKTKSILMPLLLLALLAGILFWAMKSCNKDPEPEPTPTPIVDTVVTSTTTTRSLNTLTLPDGVTIQAYPGGIEDQLIQYLGSDEYKNATEDQLKEKWFNFDDINFEFGTTKLTAESKRQADNVVAILKAYPDTKIKIGAYTDNVGDSTANLKLSQGRADAIKAALDERGFAKQVAGAEGYGSKFATVPATATDEERAIDRHCSLRLVK